MVTTVQVMEGPLEESSSSLNTVAVVVISCKDSCSLPQLNSSQASQPRVLS